MRIYRLWYNKWVKGLKGLMSWGDQNYKSLHSLRKRELEEALSLFSKAIDSFSEARRMKKRLKRTTTEDVPIIDLEFSAKKPNVRE